MPHQNQDLISPGNWNIGNHMEKTEEEKRKQEDLAYAFPRLSPLKNLLSVTLRLHQVIILGLSCGNDQIP